MQRLGREELPLHERSAHLPVPACKRVVVLATPLAQTCSLSSLLTQILTRNATDQALQKAVVTDYNLKLAARAQSFASSHWGVSRVACRVVQRRSTSRISDVTTFLQVRHRVWDSNSAFNVVLDDPTKYGFVDNTSFGQTGDFWANDFHPSSASTSQTFLSLFARQLMHVCFFAAM